MDTSKPAMEEKRRFEKELKVPLGPDALIAEQGYIQIPDRSIIFARELGSAENTGMPENDVLYAYVMNAKWAISRKDIQELEEIRDLILGPEDEITNQPPVLNADGQATGGTEFERNQLQNGFTGIGGSRCHSLTITHQHPPNKVAPASSMKILNGQLSPSQKTRKRLIKSKTAVASKIMKLCAPASFVQALDEHAEWDNLPVVGDEGNRYTPALQANLAPAVSYAEATTSGLSQMKNFGAVDGHIDDKDSVAGLTSMIVNSRIPHTYEGGRFHLLSLGVYVCLEYLSVLAFSGLNKHGGTPPIAPLNEEVKQSAVHFITVCYPPESMLNGASNVRVNLASLGKNVLSITPEVTCNQLLDNPSCSNEANVAQEGQGFMEPYPHVEFLARSLLQISNHVIGQTSEEYKAVIDPTKFLQAFSLCIPTGERVSIQPWIGAPPADTKDSSNTSLPSSDLAEASSSPISLYGNARKAHYLKWISHCEKQAQFIPSMTDCDWGIYRQRITDGDFSRRAFPRGKMKAPSLGKRKNVEGETADSNENNDTSRKKPKLASQQQTGGGPVFIGGTSGVGNLMSVINDGGPGHESDEEPDASGDFPESEDDDWLDPPPVDIPELEDNPLGPPSAAVVASLGVYKKPIDARAQRTTSMLQQQFLETLSADSIEATVSVFAAAVASLKSLASAGKLVPGAQICHTALAAISKSPLDAQTALKTTLVWGSLSTLETYVSAQSIDLSMTRALIMLSEWSLFSWVNNIVKNSIRLSAHKRHTWVDQLVDDIKHAVIDSDNHGQKCPKYTFVGTNYLPPGDYPTFPYSCRRARLNWQFNEEEHINEVFTVATDTLRCWLRFPDKKIHAARFTFIDILLSPDIPKSILYLDSVWDVFNNPARYLLQKNSDQRSRKLPKPEFLIQQRLESFRVVYQGHAIQDLDGKHRSLLAELYTLGRQFEDLLANQNGQINLPSVNEASANTSTPASLSTSGSSSIPATIMLPNQEIGQQHLVQYLRLLYRLLQNPKPLAGAAALVKRVARRPDFLMPFRQKAPVIQKAKPIFYSSSEHILTHAGIFNILAFRGAFYGSDYCASTSLRFFDSLGAWTTFYNNTKLEKPSSPEDEAAELKSGLPKGPAERWLCKLTAYGSANMNRSTQLIPIYWKAAPLLLRFLLQETRSFTQVYDFLTKDTMTSIERQLFPPGGSVSNDLDSIVSKHTLNNHFHDVGKSAFKNISALGALLVCGDLTEAGVLNMPSANDMGELLARTKMGAVKGLAELKLIPAQTALQDDASIVQAFRNLHNFVCQALSDDEVSGMGYNVLMLEHALCKLTRVTAYLPWN